MALRTDRQPPTPQAEEAEYTPLHGASEPTNTTQHAESQQNTTPTMDYTPAEAKANAELADYRKAFESEYTTATTRASKSYENVKDIFIANAESIAETIVAIAEGSRSDAIRLRAGQYVIDFVQKVHGGIDGDPINDLVNRLLGDAVEDKKLANSIEANLPEQSDADYVPVRVYTPKEK